MSLVYSIGWKFAKKSSKRYTKVSEVGRVYLSFAPMLKKFTPNFTLPFLSLCLLGLSFFWFALGQWRDSYNAEPKDVLDHVVNRLNEWNNDKIIRSELDKVSEDDGIYWDEFAIANTLESVRNNIAVYLQWLSFMAMVAATILIIYNGLRLVLSPMQADEAANVKKRMWYIVLGLLVATWFYFLIKVTLSVSIQATQ